MAMGAVLSPRLTWWAVSLVARLFGHKLPWSRVTKWDVVFLIPAAILAYVIYVANFR
jgi:hypothetical protein